MKSKVLWNLTQRMIIMLFLMKENRDCTAELSHKSPTQLQEHLNTILVSKIQHSCLYKQITMWLD